MFKKSNFSILLAVMISFLVTAYLWFIVQDREQEISTSIWITSILGFGIYFKMSALLARQ